MNRRAARAGELPFSSFTFFPFIEVQARRSRMISTSTVPVLPRRRDGLREQPIGDELMVYDPRAGAVHVLNASAARIYRLCDGSHDLDSIERDLRGGFKVPGDRDVRSDVLGAIRALCEKLLLL